MKTSLTSKDYFLEGKVNFYKNILNQIPDLIFQVTISPENDFYFSYFNKSMINFFELDDD